LQSFWKKIVKRDTGGEAKRDEYNIVLYWLAMECGRMRRAKWKKKEKEEKEEVEEAMEAMEAHGG
jgi:hypothetical protein